MLLKFLTVFIKSDVLLDVTCNEKNDQIVAKRNLFSNEKSVLDLERKIQLVKIISKCIHNQNGIIFSLLKQ